MLRNVLSLELSSTGLSETATVGGLVAELIDTTELAVEGTGESRNSVEADEADAISLTIERKWRQVAITVGRMRRVYQYMLAMSCGVEECTIGIYQLVPRGGYAQSIETGDA